MEFEYEVSAMRRSVNHGPVGGMIRMWTDKIKAVQLKALIDKILTNE